MAEIFFVDDEEWVLAGLRRTVRALDRTWRPSFHRSVREAVCAARAQPPDVVVTDLRMPQEDGFALIAAMRGVAPDARCLILSGSGDFDAALRAINRAQAFRFLTKPCAPDALHEAIEAALADRPSARPVSDGADAAGLEALSLLPTAVIVVEAGDQVVFANAAAEALLAERDGLSVDEHGRLRAAEHRHTTRLHEALATAGVGEPDFVALPRPSLRSDLCAAAAPLGPSRDGRVALLIGDPEVARAPSPDALAKLLDLTETEARIAAALANGRDVAEAADEAGVTVSTARTYLKRAFAKTGATRQADLVRLVLNTPTARTSGDRTPRRVCDA